MVRTTYTISTQHGRITCTSLSAKTCTCCSIVAGWRVLVLDIQNKRQLCCIWDEWQISAPCTSCTKVLRYRWVGMATNSDSINSAATNSACTSKLGQNWVGFQKVQHFKHLKSTTFQKVQDFKHLTSTFVSDLSCTDLIWVVWVAAAVGGDEKYIYIIVMTSKTGGFQPTVHWNYQFADKAVMLALKYHKKYDKSTSNHASLQLI